MKQFYIAGIGSLFDTPLQIAKEWIQDIRCVFEQDPAARNTLEVVLTYPGVHAVLIHRISHRLWQKNLRFPARFMSYCGREISNVDIHPAAKIGKSLFIDHGAGVVIGETAEIGDHVTLYHGVTLGGVSTQKGKRHPTLGDHVLVGAGAKILGPIEIGDQARVGANSVVIRNVPAKCTVVGIPGRVVSDAHEDNPRRTLSHHSIPDPLGKAMECMLDRMDDIERNIAQIIEQQQGVVNSKIDFAAFSMVDPYYSFCDNSDPKCKNDCIERVE